MVQEEEEEEKKDDEDESKPEKKEFDIMKLMYKILKEDGIAGLYKGLDK